MIADMTSPAREAALERLFDACLEAQATGQPLPAQVDAETLAVERLPAADDERIQAVERLTEVWPHMLVAIEMAKIEGTPKIAVLAEFGKGGRIIASFDITFLDDVQLLLPPPPRPEKPDAEGGEG